MADPQVGTLGAVVPVSAELLAEAQETRAAFQRYMSATDAERSAWAEAARVRRAAERESAERRPLTLDALLDKLGFSREYAEHLMQPYCECGDTADGWDYCWYARDEGVTPNG